MKPRIICLLLLVVCANQSEGHETKGYNGAGGGSWSKSYSSASASASASSFSGSGSFYGDNQGDLNDIHNPLNSGLPGNAAVALAIAKADVNAGGASASAGARVGAGPGGYGAGSYGGASGSLGSGSKVVSGSISSSYPGAGGSINNVISGSSITDTDEGPIKSQSGSPVKYIGDTGSYTGGSTNSNYNSPSNSGEYFGGNSGTSYSGGGPTSGSYTGGSTNPIYNSPSSTINLPGPVDSIYDSKPISSVPVSSDSNSFGGSHSGTNVGGNSGHSSGTSGTGCCKGPFPGPKGSIYDYKPAPPGGGGPDPAWLTTGNNAPAPAPVGTYTEPSGTGAKPSYVVATGVSGTVGTSGLSYNLVSSLPGPAGSIYDSKPAVGGSLATPSTGYNKQPFPQGTYSHGTGSSSTGINSVIGSLPGPSGSIYDSKPAISTSGQGAHSTVGSSASINLPGPIGSIYDSKPISSVPISSGSNSFGSSHSNQGSAANTYNTGDSPKPILTTDFNKPVISSTGSPSSGSYSGGTGTTQSCSGASCESVGLPTIGIGSGSGQSSSGSHSFGGAPNTQGTTSDTHNTGIYNSKPIAGSPYSGSYTGFHGNKPIQGCSGGSCGSYSSGINPKPPGSYSFGGTPSGSYNTDDDSPTPDYDKKPIAGSSSSGSYTGFHDNKPMQGCSGGSCGSHSGGINAPIAGSSPISPGSYSFGSAPSSQGSGSYNPGDSAPFDYNKKPIASFSSSGSYTGFHGTKPIRGCSGSSCGSDSGSINVPLDGSTPISSGSYSFGGASGTHESSSGLHNFGGSSTPDYHSKPISGSLSSRPYHDSYNNKPTKVCSGISCGTDIRVPLVPIINTNPGTLTIVGSGTGLLAPIVPLCKNNPGSKASDNGCHDAVSSDGSGSYTGTSPQQSNNGDVHDTKPLYVSSGGKDLANAQANAGAISGTIIGIPSLRSQTSCAHGSTGCSKVTPVKEEPDLGVGPGTGNLPISESTSGRYEVPGIPRDETKIGTESVSTKNSGTLLPETDKPKLEPLPLGDAVKTTGTSGVKGAPSLSGCAGGACGISSESSSSTLSNSGSNLFDKPTLCSTGLCGNSKVQNSYDSAPTDTKPGCSGSSCGPVSHSSQSGGYGPSGSTVSGCTGTSCGAPGPSEGLATGSMSIKKDDGSSTYDNKNQGPTNFGSGNSGSHGSGSKEPASDNYDGPSRDFKLGNFGKVSSYGGGNSGSVGSVTKGPGCAGGSCESSGTSHATNAGNGLGNSGGSSGSDDGFATGSVVIQKPDGSITDISNEGSDGGHSGENTGNIQPGSGCYGKACSSGLNNGSGHSSGSSSGTSGSGSGSGCATGLCSNAGPGSFSGGSGDHGGGSGSFGVVSTDFGPGPGGFGHGSGGFGHGSGGFGAGSGAFGAGSGGFGASSSSFAGSKSGSYSGSGSFASAGSSAGAGAGFGPLADLFGSKGFGPDGFSKSGAFSGSFSKGGASASSYATATAGSGSY